MFKFITEKPLWVNMLVGLGIIFVIVILFFGSLDWLTGYGKYEKVPSIVGQNILAAQKILEDNGFEVAIQDSIYIDTVAKQAVIRQTPEADAMVKQGRTIYLTVNRVVPPQVEMPNLAGFSIKSAEMYLQSLGLKLGYVTYKPDIARNAVLEQLLNDVQVKPGTKIPIGSVISFVLGSGVGVGETDVPDLIGQTLNEAKAFLSTISVNIGSVIAVGAIKDSGAAYIIKQSPDILSDAMSPTGGKLPNKIRQGQMMDLYISETPPIKDTSRITTITQ
ncbi:MAG: PASTA domain-containing protein [Sediminibacterium sp.]|nr:PASTA domain-containing protein [Sediminibacterium sp.]